MQPCQHYFTFWVLVSRREYLEIHVKGVHDQIRDHECPNCDYKSCAAGALRNHLKVCTGNERMSSGEYAVKGILESMKIPYQREMRFADCKNINSLPFDFYLPQQPQLNLTVSNTSNLLSIGEVKKP